MRAMTEDDDHDGATIYVILRPARFESETSSIAGVYRDLDEALDAAWEGDLVYESEITEAGQPMNEPVYIAYGRG